jgi:uncharacterized membrane protein YdjX (TVP38/TMEM64 family)
MALEQSQASGQAKPKSKGGMWRPIALFAVILTIIVLSTVFHLGDKIGALRDWIELQGPIGVVIFISLYVVFTVAALPGSALTVVAGALFGSVVGVIVVSIAATLGASLSFLVGRYFARDAVAGWLSQKETFLRLDKMTQDQGWIIVALTRLVPIFPFNLLNYGFGLTRVKFWTYVFWSWLCMLPGTVLYVVGADALTKGLAQGQIPWTLLSIVVGALIVLAILVRFAGKALKAKEHSSNHLPNAGHPR